MKNFFHTLYGKVSIVFLVLLIILGVVQILFSVNASMDFVRESDQQLNRNLARDLAKEFRPYLKDTLDYHGIEHTMHQLMVMNPRVEIYLLDNYGKILGFFAEPGKEVEMDSVDLAPIKNFLTKEGKIPLLGDDPRQEGRHKTFSAAPIAIGNTQGYLYVILGGEQYDSASAMIKESYIIRTTAVNLVLTLLGTSIVGLILFSFLTKRFRRMTEAVKKFEQGNFDQRTGITSQDEIGKLANAFDQMADTIVANMEELKQTDRLRRELIANVSHDLRSPLASIQGYLETIQIKNTNLSEAERAKYLQIIYDNTLMLRNLVSELFELAKLDTAQIKPELEPFSMAELTQDVILKFEPDSEQLGVDLNSILPKDLPMVFADIGMIERVLSNLIDNALNYTTEGGTVQVKLSRTNGKIRVSVSDTGCGIPAEEIALVFERFYRVEKSRALNSGGSGLGLAIAKKILDLHESDIDVESEIEKGTTFCFELKTIPGNGEA